jgi:hypothetical protein
MKIKWAVLVVLTIISLGAIANYLMEINVAFNDVRFFNIKVEYDDQGCHVLVKGLIGASSYYFARAKFQVTGDSLNIQIIGTPIKWSAQASGSFSIYKSFNKDFHSVTFGSDKKIVWP